MRVEVKDELFVPYAVMDIVENLSYFIPIPTAIKTVEDYVKLGVFGDEVLINKSKNKSCKECG